MRTMSSDLILFSSHRTNNICPKPLSACDKRFAVLTMYAETFASTRQFRLFRYERALHKAKSQSAMRRTTAVQRFPSYHRDSQSTHSTLFMPGRISNAAFVFQIIPHFTDQWLDPLDSQASIIFVAIDFVYDVRERI